MGKTTKKNILLMSARSITRYGVQTFLLNLIRSAPPEYSFTWYCPGGKERAFAEEVRREGVTVVTGGLDLFQCGLKTQCKTVMRDIWRLCHEKKYEVIHVNTGLVQFQVAALLSAWLSGVPRRIAHSHNYVPINAPRFSASRIKRFIYGKTVLLLATRTAACSHLAAEALFGKAGAQKAVVFPVGIDTERFAFSRERREVCRKKLALEGNFVLGHVGVINKQKNHRFLLDVFREIAGRNSCARLLLVGDGILEKEIRQQVKQYGLEQKVIFTGRTDRVSEYLCAMDVFVLPSVYEGMPATVVEAQASGLPCVVSDQVTPEVKLTENVSFLPLAGGAELWAEKLLAVTPRSDAERADSWTAVRDAGYDLRDMGGYVEQLYGE